MDWVSFLKATLWPNRDLPIGPKRVLALCSLSLCGECKQVHAILSLPFAENSPFASRITAMRMRAPPAIRRGLTASPMNTENKKGQVLHCNTAVWQTWPSFKPLFKNQTEKKCYFLLMTLIAVPSSADLNTQVALPPPVVAYTYSISMPASAILWATFCNSPGLLTIST